MLCIFLWAFNCLLRLKLFSHTSHFNGVLSTCLIMWELRYCTRKKAFPQTWHLNCFSCECFSIWFANEVLWNGCWQTSQTWELFNWGQLFIALWVKSCWKTEFTEYIPPWIKDLAVFVSSNGLQRKLSLSYISIYMRKTLLMFSLTILIKVLLNIS